MVKTPKARHSQTKRDPVTIDLDPASVSRATDEQDAQPIPQEAVADAGAEAHADPVQDQRAEDAAVADTGPERQWSPRDAATEAAAAAASERAAAEREQHEQAGVMPPAAPRGSAGSVIAASILGAIVAVALAGALQWAGILPSLGGSDEQADIAVLRQDVSALQSHVATLNNAPADPADSASGAALAALGERVEGAEGALAALTDAVTSLQKTPQETPEADADIGALKEQVAGLQEQMRVLAQPAPDTDLQQRLTQLEQGVATAKDDAAKADTNARNVTDLQSRLEQLGEKLAAQDKQPSVSRLVVATALKSAVDRGVAFKGELEAYAALAPEADALEPLRKYADQGVLTRAELSEQVSDVASRIVSSSEIGKGGDGLLGRLWSSASSLVVVRPVGQVEGDDVPAVAARFEADVKSGNYDKALAEYGKLPDNVRTAAADFADKLRARQAADRLLDEALSGALKAG